ncbi:hypothetical protein V6N13_011404 [Hibiscus sabdariffa]|uniref:Uncharacterized protein n=1 Tax=Hibiscus sabdariffa TaxID=183260 RepID=A0ABR2SCJ2_9ROSI
MREEWFGTGSARELPGKSPLAESTLRTLMHLSGCLPMEILPCNIAVAPQETRHTTCLLPPCLYIYPPGNKHIHRNNAFACSFLG